MQSLGEVWYDVRLSKEAAMRDMAAIERDFDAMVARMNTKLGNLRGPNGTGSASSANIPGVGSSGGGALLGAGASILGASLMRPNVYNYSQAAVPGANVAATGMFNGAFSATGTEGLAYRMQKGGGAKFGATGEVNYNFEQYTVGGQAGGGLFGLRTGMGARSFQPGPAGWGTQTATGGSGGGGGILDNIEAAMAPRGPGGGGNVVNVRVMNWPGGNGRGGSGHGGGEGGNGDGGEGLNATPGNGGAIPARGNMKSLLSTLLPGVTAASALLLAGHIAGGLGENYSHYAQADLAAGSNPFQRQMAKNDRLRGGFNTIPVLGGMGTGIGFGLADYFRLPGSDVVQKEEDIKRQLDVDQTASYANMHTQDRQSAISRGPFSPVVNNARQLLSNYQTGIEAATAENERIKLSMPKHGFDVQKLWEQIRFGQQLSTLKNTYQGGIEGNMRQARMAQLDIDSSNTQRSLSNELRPTAGFAAGTLQSASGRFENSLSELAKMGPYNKLKPEVAEAYDQQKKASRGELMSSILSLQGRETDVLSNVYGGRPTEINSRQSVEAMQDASSENTLTALTALTDAIQQLIKLYNAHP